MTGNRWQQLLENSPGHSAWYVERFRKMAAEGRDLDGEARMIDAMVPRGARILDAGCGPGRVGGRLHQLGHRVVGVDLDPALIAAAEQDHPGPRWLVGDLSELDLRSEAPGQLHEFDVVVCAGNVVTFLDPTTRPQALARMAAHLAADGRLVLGFGTDRECPVDDVLAEAAAAGLAVDGMFSTWDLRPFTPTSDFLVVILSVAAAG